MPTTPSVHTQVSTYAHQVADALRVAGITVAYVHVDSPEVAADIGHEYARIDLAEPRLVQALVWSDVRGWFASTHADRHPLQDERIMPDPTATAREAADLIRALSHT